MIKSVGIHEEDAINKDKNKKMGNEMLKEKEKKEM